MGRSDDEGRGIDAVELAAAILQRPQIVTSLGSGLVVLILNEDLFRGGLTDEPFVADRKAPR